MSTDARPSRPATRRTSVYVNGYEHANPIPAACRVDNIVYSGLIHGIDRDRDGRPEPLEAQAALMFHRLHEVVEASGGHLDDIVKVTIWMRDRSDREAVNRSWLQMFPDADDRPARQTINAQLDGDQLIQCDFVAVITQSERGDQRS